MLQQGHDLLLYVNNGTAAEPIWAPVAYSQSHKIDDTAQTQERSHKDLADPLQPEEVITKIETVITCDALISIDEQNEGYFELKAKMRAKQPIEAKYAQKNITAGGKFEKGLFVITNMSREDQVAQDSKFSITLKASGGTSIETVPQANPEP